MSFAFLLGKMKRSYNKFIMLYTININRYIVQFLKLRDSTCRDDRGGEEQPECSIRSTYYPDSVRLSQPPFCKIFGSGMCDLADSKFFSRPILILLPVYRNKWLVLYIIRCEALTWNSCAFLLHRTFIEIGGGEARAESWV